MEPAEPAALGGGVVLSRLGLGTAPLGGLYSPVEHGDALETVLSAFEEGVTYFDTAPLYGYGLAEKRLGEALAGAGERSFTVSTKVGRLLVAGERRPPGDPYSGAAEGSAVFDFSRDAVLRSLEGSLKRLGLQRVDVVYVHDPDDHPREAVDQALPALAELRSAGVVGAIGVGMNQTGLLARFAREADIDVVLCAGRYTLLDQSAAQELFPVCRERGVAVVLGGVFNSGILADPEGGAWYDYKAAGPELIARVQRIRSVCSRYSVPLRAAALQFAAANPAVASVLVGCRSATQLEDCAALARAAIPAGMWEALVDEGLLQPDAPVPSQGAAHRE